MSTLTRGDFSTWFADTHGVERPYAWQTDLLQQVIEQRRWPDLIDLPTGSGKTSVIDVALFAAALDAASPPPERWAPRRIVFVVDRRTIVDQVADHGRRIQQRLAKKSASAIGGLVADQLRHLTADQSGLGEGARSPLEVATLRGGIVRDETWALRPDVPALLTSTVDQVGSRLLFNGYGVSDRMAPVHAGLLGSDTLFLLDEVHLSRPFRDTLVRVGELAAGVPPVGRRWQVVEMSATPPHSDAPFVRFPSLKLTSSNVPDEALVRRLQASKPATLLSAKVPNSRDASRVDEAFAREVAMTTSEMIDALAEPAPVVGVVVNRVDTARRIGDLLRAGDRTPVDVEVLTGRMRSVDRDVLMRRPIAGSDLTNLLTRRSTRTPLERPLIVVATQCIEAGADFDFDLLVTECASIDALRQRFGRLDRGGARPPDRPARAAVMLRGTSPAEGDPVYGDAMARTWEWLWSMRGADDSVDFGIEQPAVAATPPPGCVPTAKAAPLLTAQHLESMAQTSPRPVASPVVSRWLHGDTEPTLDVTVLWRADLSEVLLNAARQDSDDPLRELAQAAIRQRLALCRPTTGESLSISIAAARAWLAETAVAQPMLADADSSGDPPGAIRGGFRPAVRWNVDGHCEVVGGEKLPLRPGDILVIPSEYGGLAVSADGTASGTWSPSQRTVPVPDVAMVSAMESRGTVVLRLVPGAVPPQLVFSPDDLALDEHDETTTDQDLLSDLFRGVSARSLPAEFRRAVRHLELDPQPWIVHRVEGPSQTARAGGDGARRADPVRPQSATEQSFIVRSTTRYRTLDSETGDSVAQEVVESAEDDASFIGAEGALLSEHLVGVGHIAGEFGRALGLSDDLVGDLQLAGELHDLGKADPRFQLWLRDGMPMLPNEAEPAGEPPLLAKSPRLAADATARRRARERSQYPRGARHELLSVALTSSAAVLDAASDKDLVQHLVASHHGTCRPLPPSVVDPMPLTVEYMLGSEHLEAPTDHGLEKLNSGISERFWRLGERYGWHYLAWLEAVFRLADHRRSEIEQSAPTGHSRQAEVEAGL